MRDIVFRGKRIVNGEWECGFLYCFYNFDRSVFQILGDRTNCIPDAVEVTPETVGQFIGLTDRNGERIFEGDVVKGIFLFGMEINAVVAFQGGAFGLKWRRGKVEMFQAFTSFCNVEFEVIGNIYDNPDMYSERVEE